MTVRFRPMTPGIPQGARLRAYLSGAIVTAALCGVAWRAWALQVEEGDRYREIAARQHATNVDIPAPRGDVIDRLGRPLAISADAESIWANPRDIQDVTETADRLATLIGGDAATLEDKLGGDRKFVWIGRHVAPELAQAVRAAKLPGIHVTKEPRRWYPGKTLAGPVIGRADIDSRGVEGIELSMDAVLQGQRGTGQAVRDARGRKMFANGMEQPEPGATVQLSLDRSIQAIADRALEEAVAKNQAKGGVVVVLDVATSRVLAMSSSPSYDPNASGGHARNKPITDSFEAGSVMKVFTVAAALDDGAVRPATGFDIPGGVMQVGPTTIRDTHDDKWLTVGGIIKRSSNVGAVKIAMKLGREKLYAALQKYGFGQKTRIELPGEQSGNLRGGKWREIELATISYGYGITVTPLQIAAALAAIGNRGEYRAPRIVERITDRSGTVLYEASTEPRQMVKPATAEAMREMLASVFEGGKEDGGTAASIVVPGFLAGGKTGTAHKYDPAIRRYSSDKYLSSFAGLAPIENPRLAIVVLIDEPTGGAYYGGKVAGPVFATVASESLRYLGVPGRSLVCPPPVRGVIDTRPKTCTIPAPKPAPETATRDARPAPPPEPEAGSETAELSALPEPGPDEILVPDFTGLGVARALDLARSHQVAIDLAGSGEVVAQDPPPGLAPATTRIHLTLSDGKTPMASARTRPR